MIVEVTGARAWSGPATWGQRTIWRTVGWMGAQGSYFNMAVDVPAPPGTTLDAVARAVAVLAARHDALRTRFAGDGREAIVDRAGAVRVEPGPGDRTAVTFDPAADWPVAAYLDADRVTLILSHLTVDGAASRILAAELGALLAGPDRALPPPSGQPSDIAEYERTDAAWRRHERAMTYWADTLWRVPAGMFGPPRTPAQPRFQLLKLDSVAAAVAATAVAGRLRVSTSSVLLAAAAVALAGHCGRDEAVLRLIVGNRFDAARRGIVGTFSQNGLFHARVLPSAHDTVREVFSAMMRCFQHGYYEPGAMQALLDESDVDLGAFFNDVRAADGWAGLPSEVDGDPGARLWADGGWDRIDATFFVTAADTAGRAQLHLLADTAHVAPEAMGTVLMGMRDWLVAAARHG